MTGTATGTTRCAPNRRLHQPPPPPPARAPAHPEWAYPALTGLDTAEWDQLISTLDAPRRLQRDVALHIARGGPPTRKPGAGHPPALTLAERVLVTVLQRRFGTPRPALATLFGVSIGTVTTATRETEKLLDQYGPPIPPALTPIRTLADLAAHAAKHGITLIPKIKPAR